MQFGAAHARSEARQSVVAQFYSPYCDVIRAKIILLAGALAIWPSTPGEAADASNGAAASCTGSVSFVEASGKAISGAGVKLHGGVGTGDINHPEGSQRKHELQYAP